MSVRVDNLRERLVGLDESRADVERYGAASAELRDDYLGPGPQARITDGEEIPRPAE